MKTLNTLSKNELIKNLVAKNNRNAADCVACTSNCGGKRPRPKRA